MQKPKFVKRKKSNNKRAFVLFILLVVILVLWKNMDKIMDMIFN